MAKETLTHDELRAFMLRFLTNEGISIRSASRSANISHPALLKALRSGGRTGTKTLIRVLEALGCRVTTRHEVRTPRKTKPRRSIYFG